MKRIIKLLLAAASLGAPMAQAFTYHDEEVLLVFRKPGYDNVLFNIGNVSQFLGKPNGYSAVVGNFNLGLVTATYGTDLSDDVRVVLLSTTSPFSANRRAWLSSAEPNTQAYDRTSSQWQSQLYSKINAIGDKPQSYTQTSAVPSYVVEPTHISSYDYIASDAHINDLELPKLGGSAAFVVEQAIPTSLNFWEIKPSAINPKPASTLVGTFTLGTNGVLVFSVGGSVPQPSATVARAGGITTVTFDTTSGGNYRLRWTNVLGASVTDWATVGSSVPGNGSNQSLQHTNNDSAAFYAVERTP